MVSPDAVAPPHEPRRSRLDRRRRGRRGLADRLRGDDVHGRRGRHGRKRRGADGRVASRLYLRPRLDGAQLEPAPLPRAAGAVGGRHGRRRDGRHRADGRLVRRRGPLRGPRIGDLRRQRKPEPRRSLVARLHPAARHADADSLSRPRRALPLHLGGDAPPRPSPRHRAFLAARLGRSRNDGLRRPFAGLLRQGRLRPRERHGAARRRHERPLLPGLFLRLRARRGDRPRRDRDHGRLDLRRLAHGGLRNELRLFERTRRRPPGRLRGRPRRRLGRRRLRVAGRMGRRAGGARARRGRRRPGGERLRVRRLRPLVRGRDRDERGGRRPLPLRRDRPRTHARRHVRADRRRQLRPRLPTRASSRRSTGRTTGTRSAGTRTRNTPS